MRRYSQEHQPTGVDRRYVGPSRCQRLAKLLSTTAVSVAIAATFLPPASQARVNPNGFCKTTVIRDYEKPLREMPAVRHAPDPGKVPGGPPGFRLRPVLHVLTAAGIVGFAAEGNMPMKAWWPAWQVSGSFWQVTRSGKKLADSQRHRRFASGIETSLQQRELGFRVSGKPAFYRVDIVFQHKARGARVKFSEYFRVMRPRTDVRLKVGSPSYRPGDTALMRLENFGTTGFATGPYYVVERYDGNTWLEIPELAGPNYALLWGLGSGLASWCQRLHLPDYLVPGRYRITKDGSARSGARSRIYVQAEFELLP